MTTALVIVVYNDEVVIREVTTEHEELDIVGFVMERAAKQIADEKWWSISSKPRIQTITIADTSINIYIYKAAAIL